MIKDNYITYNKNYDFVSIKNTFDPIETKHLNFSQMQKTYIKQHIKKLPKESQEAIQNISKQIIKKNKGKLNTSGVATIPIFIKENSLNILSLIKLLEKQEGDFIAILYINGYEEKDKKNKKNLTEKIKKLEKRIRKNNIIIIGHIYKEQQLMGAFVSDMKDGVIISCHNKKNPIIIRMDADTYDIQPGYIKKILELYKNNTQISYTNTKIYGTKPDSHYFVRLAEMISDLAGYWNSQDKTQVPTYGGGMAFKAIDWMKIKGSQRDISRMEDYVIAWKITQYYGSVEKPDYSRGMRSNEIVYCHPRRQIQNLLQGRYYHQNTYEFNFVEKNKLDFAKLEPYNIAVKKMINKVYTSLQELCLIEDYINRFSIDLRDIRLEFSEYWNKYVSEYSLYKAIVDNKGIHFIEKNFID